MSKRTPGLPQRPRGFWPTPLEAVAPLVPLLPLRARYGEPCAGDGRLVEHIERLLPTADCVWMSDIEPQAPGICKRDALELDADSMPALSMFITNLPWPTTGKKGDPAIGLIRHLTSIAPLWTILPFCFAANEYFRRVAPMCAEILPIGRVSWLENGKPGKDDSAWFLFDAANRRPTVLHARGA